MSFHEKSAWVSLISIIGVSTFYFLHVSWSLTPEPSGQLVRGLLYCIVGFVIIEVIGHTVISIRTPRDAQTPRDEREQLINLKAVRAAAYVYVGGSFLAVSTLHLGASGITIGYGVLLAFVAAEVVNYATRIVYHRRGV